LRIQEKNLQTLLEELTALLATEASFIIDGKIAKDIE
jgi:hypothetical protein